LTDHLDTQTSQQRHTPGERNIAALVEWNRRRSEARYPAAEARPVRSGGIVGAGVMGTSIAAAAVGANVPVVITDVRQEVLDSLPGRMADELAGEPDSSWPQDRTAADGLLRTTADVAEVARCDLVIETVIEDRFLKERVLADLEPKLAPGAVLASNTSTISIDLCGLHFFLPVRRRKLVEIVVGARSNRATLATGAAFVRSLDKIPLLVPDSAGFLVNRLMMVYLSEGLQLVTDGVPIEQIEQVATDFGMALGPMSLIDQIGVDVVLDCAWVLAGALGESMVRAPFVVTMVKGGRLGRKSGAGFFRYAADGSKDPEGLPDPALAPLLADWAAEQKPQDPETITARLFLPMVLEATRILAEGRVDDPRDIDLAVVFGFGFPAARGGLLYWADTLGVSRVVEMLGPLEGLGPRTQPTSWLLEMAAPPRRFYPEPQGQKPEENKEPQ